MRDVGDQLSTAKQIQPDFRKTVLKNTIGNTDTADVYRFNFSKSKHFKLNLRKLSINADVELIQDTNGNQQIDSGEIIASSRTTRGKKEALRLNRIQAGTYYVRVIPESSGKTNYRLVLRAKRASKPTFEEKVVALTNKRRLQNGLSPLTLNTQLTLASERHSRNMAMQNFFSHTGRDGSSPSDRARATGYSSNAGENISAGLQSPKDVVDEWMNSPGHRANILNRDYKEIGVGFFSNNGSQYTHYWTQMFSFG